jgi:hypothetical protein
MGWVRYSDSDSEEHRIKEAAIPDWAKEDQLRDALENQETRNPTKIFGEIQPLRMEGEKILEFFSKI